MKNLQEIKDETLQEETETIRGDEETANNNLEATIEDIEETIQKEDTNGIENQLTEKTAQYEDMLDKFQRLQADFANYKRRVEKEKSDIFIYANEKLGLDLLEVIDNLERAMGSQDEEGSTEEVSCIIDGISLVYKQLIDTLAKHGIKEIDALGKPFDANFHHAVMQEESESEPDCVIEVFQKGYTINQRVLRPSMVKVSK